MPPIESIPETLHQRVQTVKRTKTKLSVQDHSQNVKNWSVSYICDFLKGRHSHGYHPVNVATTTATNTTATNTTEAKTAAKPFINESPWKLIKDPLLKARKSALGGDVGKTTRGKRCSGFYACYIR